MIDRPVPLIPASGRGRIARRLVRAWAGRAALAAKVRYRREIAAILAGLPDRHPEAARWVVLGARAGDPLLCFVGPPGGPPAGILRIARSPVAATGLLRAAAALEQLAAGVGGSAAGLLPGLVARSDDAVAGPAGAAPGAAAEATWLVETVVPGRVATALLADSPGRRAMLAAVAAVTPHIHAVGSATAIVGDAELERWVGRRVAVVRDVLGGGTATADDIRRLEAGLDAALRGRSVRVGWIHGDLWPGNVIVGAGDSRVAGIIDWDSATPGEPAAIDRLHLAVTTRRVVEHRSFGAVVAGLLDGGPWTADDRAVLGPDLAGAAISDDEPSAPPSPAAPADAGRPTTDLPANEAAIALRLTWLWTITANLDRHPDLGRDRRWLAANVRTVLACR